MIHKVRTEEHDCGLNESRIQIMASISISHLWSRLCWNRPLQRCTTLTRHTLWHMHALVHILKYNHEITVSRLPLCMCHGHTRHTHKQWQTDKVSLSQRQNRAHCVKSNQCKHTIRGYQPRWQGREFAKPDVPIERWWYQRVGRWVGVWVSITTEPAAAEEEEENPLWATVEGEGVVQHSLDM